MRANGAPEAKVTGDAEPFEKFLEFAKALEMAIGNPMYHWSHLELKKYFGITEPLTDSRSFLSYTRHDYFRRIACNLIGKWVEDGEYPDNEASLKKIVEGISYYNAARYFGI